MYNRIIMTSGTSLLFNHKALIEEEFPGFFHLDETLTEEKIAVSDEVIQFLNNYLKNNLVLNHASAEISMLKALVEQKRAVKSPDISLFYTDTLKGRTAGLVNKKVFEKVFESKVKLEEIYDVNVDNRAVLNRGLGRYLSDISKALQEGEPNTTCFAPIGGYKVMTSLGYLVGAIHHYPTAYLHEGSSILHEIPPVQIEIDEKFIVDNHNLLRRFFREDILEKKELTKGELSLISKQSTLFEIVDELVALNPFGRFLCDQKKYHQYFKPKLKMAKSTKEWIDRRYPSNWDVVYKEVNELIYQRSSGSPKHYPTLYHESDFIMLKGEKLVYHLYKGGNTPVFRATWNYSENEDCYYIAMVWFNHAQYERDVAKKIGLIENNNEWIDLTQETIE